VILRDEKKARIFQFDKRKKKKVSPLAILLIEHLTEESNGHITAYFFLLSFVKLKNSNGKVTVFNKTQKR
jgi:hypothetical protein